MSEAQVDRLEELARILHDARLAARETPRITEKGPLSVDEAYSVMESGIGLREHDGEQVIAYKMGLTSEAKRRQMGLDQAIFGILTDRMQLRAEAPYPLEGRIHPKAEPEIAFRVSQMLDARNGSISPDEAWNAVAEVAPAIEVLDSRYVGFKYFSLPDVIADNASSSDYLIGTPVAKPAHWSELESWKIDFMVNGTVQHHAMGSEISGSPIRSLVELTELLARRNQVLPAGCWVLLGAATPAVALESGMAVELQLRGPGDPPSRLRLDVGPISDGHQRTAASFS
jgi:2-oxo-3-hexenedioate decarboxylase